MGLRRPGARPAHPSDDKPSAKGNRIKNSHGLKNGDSGIGMDVKRQYAQKVIEECFWGDYDLSADELLLRLENGEPGFDTFIFSKIIENSSRPSVYLPVLFPAIALDALLKRYLQVAGHKKRVRLVAANLTGQFNLVPELQWTR